MVWHAEVASVYALVLGCAGFALIGVSFMVVPFVVSSLSPYSLGSSLGLGPTAEPGAPLNLERLWPFDVLLCTMGVKCILFVAVGVSPRLQP